MTDRRTAAIRYYRDNQMRFLDELKAISGIASISTDPASQVYMQEAAEWIAAKLRALNMENVTVFPTAGHPLGIC
jgi:acetylornithine deacetylase/succinyl-diaminopimelate desuccinylase-like protein